MPGIQPKIGILDNPFKIVGRNFLTLLNLLFLSNLSIFIVFGPTSMMFVLFYSIVFGFYPFYYPFYANLNAVK